jgi:hypothetical protein
MTFTVGQRVRSTGVIDIYPLNVWPVGTTGTVVEVGTCAPLAMHVKLDDHFDVLDEWSNELQVWPIDRPEGGNCNVSHWEAIPSA